MLAMDIPVSMMAGMVLADAGSNLIKSNDEYKIKFLKVFVLMYAAIFIAPTPVYYYLGWPAWEINFLGGWADSSLDSPLKAAFSFVLLAVAVLPTYWGLIIGKKLIIKDKIKLVRIIYVVLLLCVGIIILLLYDITFNISSTYAKYQAGDSYSFWSHPFVTGWGITAFYFWASLFGFYLWLRKKS